MVTNEQARKVAEIYQAKFKSLDDTGEARIDITEAPNCITFSGSSTDCLEGTYLTIRPNFFHDNFLVIDADYGKRGFLGRDHGVNETMTLERLREVFEEFYQDWESCINRQS